MWVKVMLYTPCVALVAKSSYPWFKKLGAFNGVFTLSLLVVMGSYDKKLGKETVARVL